MIPIPRRRGGTGVSLPAVVRGCYPRRMWCPTCKSEYREGITRCEACEVDLVREEPDPDYPMGTGPLTGRPIEDELEATGPVVAGNFVTMEEAQAAQRALTDGGIWSEVDARGEQLPMTIIGAEPGYAVVVAPREGGRARRILREMGIVPVAVARFRLEADAHSARALLESKGLKPRISVIVLDEMPAEFREEMEPYILEVPVEEEGAALEILRGSVLRVCAACGNQVRPGDAACRTCGEPTGA